MTPEQYAAFLVWLDAIQQENEADYVAASNEEIHEFMDGCRAQVEQIKQYLQEHV